MVSPEALKLNGILRAAPKAVDMDLPRQREAGEHAEVMTSEPKGVRYEDAPEVGVWATPHDWDGRSAIVYLYGGGYVISSPRSRRKLAGHLANASSARVLVPRYRLAPESPFPAAVKDAAAAYRWLLGEGHRPGRVVVAGDSSAAVDLTATRASLLRMAGQYLDGADPRAPLASPLYADLSGLPPLLVVVGGDEALLDDSVRLVRRAGMAGVDVTLHVGAGMQHIFPIYCGAMPEADAAVAMIGGWIRSLSSRAA